MKKPIIAMILIIFIMIIPVNASILTFPELPGEYEDYIIYYSYTIGQEHKIFAITFDKPVNMHVGTYYEYLGIYPEVEDYFHHSHDILYFRRKGEEKIIINRYELIGGEWEHEGSWFNDAFRVGATGNKSVQESDILYASRDVIDMADGSVFFFFEGSWMKGAMVRPILGLMLYLSGLVIALVAFWKGLQYLYRTLRTL